jgi:hypothetical protein
VQSVAHDFALFLVKSHDPATTVMGCMKFHVRQIEGQYFIILLIRTVPRIRTADRG